MKNRYNIEIPVSRFLISFLKRGCIPVLAILLCSTSNLFAQENPLTRVSSTERSDGQGHVVRFHLSQRVDSFKVFQPGDGLIQMALYAEPLDTVGIEYDNSTPVYDEIGFYSIPSGIGVDLYIPEGTFFSANAYHDGNSEDLLLGLTYTDRENVESLAAGVEPVIWSSLSISEENLLSGGPTPGDQVFVDDTYQLIKDKLKFDVVVIDAGHGGHDPGTIGYRGTKEKDIVLNIAKKVGAYINEYMPGVEVVYTREDDTFLDLEERGSIANRAEGDLFISIHSNGHSSRQPSGTEVFFLGLERSASALETMKRENSVIQLDRNAEQTELTQEDLVLYELANSGYIATSEQIAGMIDNQFENRAMRRSRGVKQARLVVLYHASMPAVLVETGFISNPSEERYLTTEYGQSIIASAIFRAVRDYKEQYEGSPNFNAISN